MLVRRIVLENVRSFLSRQELLLDGPITILIGPNGGGKTNLLDTIVMLLRRYLFASWYATASPTPENPDQFEFRYNDVLNNMILEKHSRGTSLQQLLEIEIEVAANDLQSMRLMSSDAKRITDMASPKYRNFDMSRSAAWNIDAIHAGDRFTYILRDGNLVTQNESAAHFLQYLNLFEVDALLRAEYGLASLDTPLVYLPVHRSTDGFQSRIELSNYNEYELSRQNAGTFSRSAVQIVSLAIGRLAQKYRLLLEKDSGKARIQFESDSSLLQMTSLLRELGYEWSLESINPIRNQYDIKLSKQGNSFLVRNASSGEKELLTYLFAIFALNVRNALIVVDEPELHLHPKWQKTLIRLFIKLAKSTGNQFVIATHAPVFVAPDTIEYVSRVFSVNQESQVARLDASALPGAKHVLKIVNSQNNERLFFADKVVLVEGPSDRIFFESVLDRFGRASLAGRVVEVIDVGGKGQFDAYAELLGACRVQSARIADLDYIEQKGNQALKQLFRLDHKKVKTALEDVSSIDATTLVNSIDDAMNNETWANSRTIWEYLKARRRVLRSDLSPEEEDMKNRFILEMRPTGVYILKSGALEDYLPSGYHGKDIAKLITFLARESYWDELPKHSRDEMEEISLHILC